MTEGFPCSAENSVLFVKIHSIIRYSRHDNVFLKKFLGDPSGRGIPGHIPNPEVKPVSADGTWGATPWESRSLPRSFFFNYFPGKLSTGVFVIYPTPRLPRWPEQRCWLLYNRILVYQLYFISLMSIMSDDYTGTIVRRWPQSVSRPI